MVLKTLWIKILFIKLTNSSKHSLMLAKTSIEVHLMHEFMPLDLFLVFCSKDAQSATLGLKLMFWMVLRHFIVAPDPLRNKYRGAFNARVYASKTISCLVAMNMLNPQL